MFYKSQYEQLETELADFQASSRELETELERDVEEAEKRERQLREKVETLNYEVEEWKVGLAHPHNGEAHEAHHLDSPSVNNLSRRPILHRIHYKKR